MVTKKEIKELEEYKQNKKKLLELLSEIKALRRKIDAFERKV